MPIQRAKVALNQITGGTPITSVGFSDLPVGSVVQTVTARSANGTNNTSSNSFVDITPSQISITAKRDNSSFLYKASLSAESDVAGGYNSYIRPVYTLNGGSTVVHDSTKVLNGTTIKDDEGVLNLGITYLFDGITSSAGSTFVFFIQYSKSSASSVFFNQQSLTGQPTSTDNICSIVVQEIAV